MMIDTEPSTRPYDRDPLQQLQNLIALSSQDWAAARDFAWLYGIVVGWDDDEVLPEEDRSDAMLTLTERFQWSDQLVAQLRALHTEFERIAAQYRAQAEIPRIHGLRGRVHYGTAVRAHSDDEITVETSPEDITGLYALLRVNPDSVWQAEREASVVLDRSAAAALRDRLDAWLTDTAQETE